MATEIERLVVSLEASITKFDRTMQKALGITNNTMRKIEQRQATAIQKLNAGWSGLQRGVASAFATAAALRGAQQLVDASTRIENSLKVVGLAGEELDRVYQSLFQSAQRNMAPVETLTTLFSRLGLAQKELGVTTDELLSFTDNVALALRVQGTTSDEARGALIQLSQAMGSGIVRAEEFNSVVEGAPSILRAAAAGLKEANGSVAALRKLVIDGKVSSEAFFRAFQAGSVILQEQVAGAEVTISQGFVRLQNVLIDTAGKLDEATGASVRIGAGLTDLANIIDALGNTAVDNKDSVSSFIDQVGISAQNLPIFADIRRGVEALRALTREGSEARAIIDELTASFDKFGPTVSDTDIALGEAEQTLASFADNTVGKMGEIDAAAQDLFQQVLEGKGSARLAAEAIEALGDANPDFAPLLSKIGATIQQIYALRAAAISATRMDEIGAAPKFSELQSFGASPTVQPVSLSDYKAPAGVGGGGGSKRDQYAAAVAAQQERIDALTRETALQAQLNPLVNDYGFAVEKLRAQIELENAAKEQGLALDEPRRQQIEELSSGYARATAEAARLAEAQDKARQSAEDLANAGREALDTIIDGFLEGKDAGEIFGNVLKDLGRNLLNMGLNGLFSGFGGGGNPLAALFGGFRAGGGPVQAGKAYVVGEKRPELFVPGQSGTIVPRIPDVAGISAPPTTATSSITLMAGAIQIDGSGLNQAQMTTAISDALERYDRKTLPRRVNELKNNTMVVNG
ncbi:hypothetical protein JP75_08060 [Devosia riboflavina]|uniref:Tape measure protein N-terminal domain-containing protein n=1 Tax=Devosia riboflavina TaxID=46914 RepID=A0A087M3N2_9HYPH|nr:hypothetical protein JP75_08060 [Devosia riboflavina]